MVMMKFESKEYEDSEGTLKALVHSVEYKTATR